MASAATQFITRTYQQPYPTGKLQWTAKKGKPALNNAADPYNEFIWALAQKFTKSPEEAKAAVEEIQTDINRCAERGIDLKSNEDRLIARIAWRRLIKFLQ